MAKQTFTTGQVLTAAQMTSLQQTAMLGGAASAKTASYTLVATDAGTAISMSNASPTTITVNTSLFAAGDTIQITNLGAGVCTITAGTATVNTSASLALAQYESGTLDFTSTSAAIFIKGAGAAATSGGMTLLASGSLAAAQVGVDLTSISQDYKELVLIGSGLSFSTANASVGVRLNNDSGANYDWIFTIFAATYGVDAANEIQGSILSATAPTNGQMIMIFPNYTDTTSGQIVNTSGYIGASVGEGVGFWYTTSAVTRITYRTSAGAFDAGTYELYGVK